MKIGYALGRVGDLTKGDWLEVRCSCGHVGIVNPVDLHRESPLTTLEALEPRYRCGKCRRRGRVIVAVLDNR